MVILLLSKFANLDDKRQGRSEIRKAKLSAQMVAFDNQPGRDPYAKRLDLFLGQPQYATPAGHATLVGQLSTATHHGYHFSGQVILLFMIWSTGPKVVPSDDCA